MSGTVERNRDDQPDALGTRIDHELSAQDGDAFFQRVRTDAYLVQRDQIVFTRERKAVPVVAHLDTHTSVVYRQIDGD